MFANVLQLRRKIAVLERDIRARNKIADIGESQQAPR